MKQVVADRTLPLIYAEMVREAGIGVECDASIGVADRRRKDADEAWPTSARRRRSTSRSSSGPAA